MGRIVQAGFGAPARRALGQLIADAQAGDPLAPVTVVVPSNLVGLATRRNLAAEGGLLNVRWMVTARLAELIASGAAQPSDGPPATAAMVHEAARSALAERRHLFGAGADVAEHPATVEAVLELREALPTLTRLPVEGWAAGLVELVADIDARLAHAGTDGAHCRRASALVAAGHAAAREAGHVIAYLPDRPPPAEVELLAALAGARRLDVVVGATADAAATASQLEALSGLGLDVERVDTPAPPRASHVVIAPDPRSEVRHAVREVIARASAGVALHRCAIVAPVRWPTTALIHSELERAQLPHHGTNPRTLAHSAVGRLLSGLLALDPRLDRAAVLAWLASAPVVDRHGAPVPLAHWTRLAARAGVVRDAGQWQQRLERLAEASEVDRPDDAAQARAFAALVADLAAALAPPGRRPWREHVAATVAALERFLPDPSSDERWPAGEAEAARLVVRALEGLSLLDDVGAPVDAAGFRSAVDRALGVRGSRIGTYGDGVLVGTLDDIVGLELDVVVAVGLVEGVCPPTPHDPSLVAAVDPTGTEERRRRRRADQRRRFDAALASASATGTVVLSMARTDPWRGRTTWPAPWLVEQAGALARRAVTAESLLTDRARRDDRWRTVLPSRTAQLADVAAATSESELLVGSAWAWRQTGSVEAHPWLIASGVDRQLRAVTARASAEFTEWDGYVGAGVIERPVTTAISPTSLERWATCPRRYLFENVLQVRPDQDPVEDDVLNPVDRGSLVHDVLEAVVRAQLDDPTLVDGSARLIDVAEEILERHCDRYEAMGRTGRGLPWTLGREHLGRELRRFIRADAQFREDHGLAPSHVEVSFGIEADDLPVTVPIAGDLELSFRGRIDRLDVSADRTTAVVTDYKTGKFLTDSAVAGGAADGTKLQLPLYGLAVRALVPEATTVRARYWFLFGTGQWRTAELVVDDDAVARLGEVASAITEGIAAGVFPARPGEPSWDSYTNCGFCPFDRVCPPDRRLAWDRKQESPVLGPIRRLTASGAEAVAASKTSKGPGGRTGRAPS